MVIKDTAFHMPANGSGYITDNRQYHNFFNGSEVDRVHIVATLVKTNFGTIHINEGWRDEVEYDNKDYQKGK